MKIVPILAAMAFAALALSGCGQNDDASTAPAPTSPAPIAPAASTPIALAPPPKPLDASVQPHYTLQSSEDCTVDRDQPCRRISIVVPKGQSRAQIASDLSHAAQMAAASYGSVRGIVFARAEGTDKNGPYSAGRAVWGANEDTDHIYTAEAPSVDYVDDYFKPEAPAPPSVSRFSEPVRKRIFYETGLAENKAQHEADAAYPIDRTDNAEEMDQSQRNITPNGDMNNDLTEKYHAQVRRRRHITEAQFDAIQSEGLEKHWPVPDASEMPSKMGNIQ